MEIDYRRGPGSRAGRRSPTRRSRPSTTISPPTTTTSSGSSTLLPKLERHRLQGRRLLDVACGTGKSFIPMLERGWEVTACDISAAMVEVARGKVGDAGAALGRRHAAAAGIRQVRPRLVPRRRGQLPARPRRTGAGADRDAAQPRARRAADVRRQHAADLPHLLRRRGGDRARRPAPDLARAGKPRAGAEHDRRSELRGRADRPGGRTADPGRRCTASATSPKPRCSPRWRCAGLECLDVFGHDDDAIPQQPLDEERHSKAVYIARAASGSPPPTPE